MVIQVPHQSSVSKVKWGAEPAPPDINKTEQGSRNWAYSSTPLSPTPGVSVAQREAEPPYTLSIHQIK